MLKNGLASGSSIVKRHLPSGITYSKAFCGTASILYLINLWRFLEGLLSLKREIVLNGCYWKAIWNNPCPWGPGNDLSLSHSQDLGLFQMAFQWHLFKHFLNWCIYHQNYIIWIRDLESLLKKQLMWAISKVSEKSQQTVVTFVIVERLVYKTTHCNLVSKRLCGHLSCNFFFWKGTGPQEAAWQDNVWINIFAHLNSKRPSASLGRTISKIHCTSLH